MEESYLRMIRALTPREIGCLGYLYAASNSVSGSKLKRDLVDAIRADDTEAEELSFQLTLHNLRAKGLVTINGTSGDRAHLGSETMYNVTKKGARLNRVLGHLSYNTLETEIV